MVWWIVGGLLLLVWALSQASAARCRAEMRNPACPLFTLSTRHGWDVEACFALYLARRSQRMGNTPLAISELRAAVGKSAGSGDPASLVSLAMAYVCDDWSSGP